MNKWKVFFKALLESRQKSAPQRFIAKHLARIPLYELSGKDLLLPDVKLKMEQLELVMAEHGKPIWIVSMFRTWKEQNDLYAKGRNKSGKIITNARGGQSYHNYGLAFDVAFRNFNWDPPAWDWWEILGEEGRKVGLIWGGSFKDYGHFEYHPNFTWRDLINYFK